MKFFASPRSKQEQAPRQVAPGHDSRAIANIFVGKSHQAGKPLTITPLVKLVYFAHGWTLGYTGEPLILDPVEAWRYGPVVPLVYKTFRPQGIFMLSPAIDAEGQPYTTKVSPVQSNIISNVYKEYSRLSIRDLTRITHEKDTPWYPYNGKPYALMDNEDIKRYYQERVEKLKQSNVGQS